MIVDLYPDGAQTAVRILTIILQSKSILVSKAERLDLEQFISDLQDELDNEAERQWLARYSISND